MQEWQTQAQPEEDADYASHGFGSLLSGRSKHDLSGRSNSAALSESEDVSAVEPTEQPVEAPKAITEDRGQEAEDGVAAEAETIDPAQFSTQLSPWEDLTSPAPQAEAVPVSIIVPAADPEGAQEEHADEIQGQESANPWADMTDSSSTQPGGENDIPPPVDGPKVELEDDSLPSQGEALF